jgi:hypothetical protein
VSSSLIEPHRHARPDDALLKGECLRDGAPTQAVHVHRHKDGEGKGLLIGGCKHGVEARTIKCRPGHVVVCVDVGRIERPASSGDEVAGKLNLTRHSGLVVIALSGVAGGPHASDSSLDPSSSPSISARAFGIPRIVYLSAFGAQHLQSRSEQAEQSFVVQGE